MSLVNVARDTGMVAVLEEAGGRQLVALAGNPGPRGAAGPAGLDGGVTPAHTFAWGDATPDLVATVAAGKRVFSVSLAIETAFNGTGAQIQVGTLAAPDLLMAATSNAPGSVAVYETNPNVFFGTETGIYLTITPGSAASQGAGALILETLS